MLHHSGDVTNLPRAAGGGDDVEVRRQRRVAGSHAENSLTRMAPPGFGFTDGDCVSTGGQMRDGDGEVFSVNLLAKRRRIVARAFNGQ